MGSSFHCRLAWAAFILIAVLASAGATALLKPTGESMQPLPLKALEAEAQVEGQFATTRLLLTFENTADRRIEADFLYELPPHAVPISFAYWFGAEKVVAKVMEQEKARAIYNYITSRQRDPALVELVGERTLRAKIFPVMPNSDLRVEIGYVQVLPAAAGNTVPYTLPLVEEDGTPLASVSVDVWVRKALGLTGVTNNYGLQDAWVGGDYHVQLKGTYYLPPKDFTVRQTFDPTPLRALSVAAASPGEDGYFAVALTPEHTVRNPRLRISGVTTSEVMPEELPDVPAGTSLFLCGRYRGGGPVTFTLTGTGDSGPLTYTARAEFSREPRADNPARWLWAAKRLALLTDQDEIVATSIQYGIPSKYTSWLAVPKEEMARYEREMAQAQMSATADRLAQLNNANRGQCVEARRLRQELRTLGARCGQDPVEYEKNHTAWYAQQIYDQDFWKAGVQYAEMIVAGTERRAQGRKLYARMQALATKMRYYQPVEAIRNGLQYHTNRVARELAGLIRNKQEHTPRARALHATLKRYARYAKTDSRYELSWQLEGTLHAVADKLVAAQYQPMPDTARIDALRAEMQRLIRYSIYISYDDAVRYAEQRRLYKLYESARMTFESELRKETPDPRVLAATKETILAFFNRDGGGEEYAAARLERITVRIEAEKLDRRIADLLGARQAVPAEMTARAQALNLRYAELRVRNGDPLITVAAPADARSVIAILPGGEMLKCLYNPARKRWEARFDVPAHAQSGTYTVPIIIVLKDGTQRGETFTYHVDLEPPTGTATARAVRNPAPGVRLEVTGSADLARVTAVLPWGARVELRRIEKGRYYTLTPLPRDAALGTATFILTDGAHNRTTLTAAITEDGR